MEQVMNVTIAGTQYVPEYFCKLETLSFLQMLLLILQAHPFESLLAFVIVFFIAYLTFIATLTYR